VCPDDSFARGILAPATRSSVSRDAPIQVTSNAASIAIAGDAAVTGQVTVNQGDRQLSADRVRVDKATNSVSVKGNVEYTDPQLKVQGTAGRYDAGAAQFNDARFQLPQQASRGSASALRLDPTGVLHLDGVRYTTCPDEQHPDWRIVAAEVSIDSNNQSGVARNASIRFNVHRLPAVAVVPGGHAAQERLSVPQRGQFAARRPAAVGALLPGPGARLRPRRRAHGVCAPRCRPVRQLPLSPQSSRGSLDANFLDDRLIGSNRSRLEWVSSTELPRDWRLRINAQNVSDAAYFEDFATGADGTSVAFLPRQLTLSYRDATWRSGVVLRNFQTIDSGLATADRPYTELPRLYAQGQWASSLLRGLDYGLDSEAVDFQRNTGVRGWRLDLRPRLDLRAEGAGWFVHPGVAWQDTRYQLTDTAAGSPANPSRSLPSATLDAGLVFERSAGSGGRRRVTLEPRLLYLYTPYRNQDALPVFDTGLPDFSTVALFRSNRYVGADRVGDANQLAAGVTARLFSSSSGTRFLSATLGQIVYFTPPKVRLPGEAARPAGTSDLVAQVELKALDNWSVDLGTQWDHTTGKAQKSDLRLQYRPDGGSVVNLGYRFQRDRLEQADVSAAWPVSPQWSLYGRMLYSLRDKGSIEQFAGFQYSSCCWGVRAVARNYVSTRTGERDTGVFLQLELKGLSSVGTRADAFLERAIRGYSPVSRGR
jgi:LPS-assembly protein